MYHYAYNARRKYDVAYTNPTMNYQIFLNLQKPKNITDHIAHLLEHHVYQQHHYMFHNRHSYRVHEDCQLLLYHLNKPEFVEKSKKEQDI